MNKRSQSLAVVDDKSVNPHASTLLDNTRKMRADMNKATGAKAPRPMRQTAEGVKNAANSFHYGPVEDEELLRRRTKLRAMIGGLMGILPGAVAGAGMGRLADPGVGPPVGGLLGAAGGFGAGALAGGIYDAAHRWAGLDPLTRPFDPYPEPIWLDRAAARKSSEANQKSASFRGFEDRCRELGVDPVFMAKYAARRGSTRA